MSSAQICEMHIYDEDGDKSFIISHTVSDTIKIEDIGLSTIIELYYDEARAIAKALRLILKEAERRGPEQTKAKP